MIGIPKSYIKYKSLIIKSCPFQFPKTNFNTVGLVQFGVNFGKVIVVPKSDPYSMSHFDELNQLGLAGFYSALNLTKGYLIIPVTLVTFFIFNQTLPTSHSA